MKTQHRQDTITNPQLNTRGILSKTQDENSIRDGKTKHVTFWDEPNTPTQNLNILKPQRTGTHTTEWAKSPTVTVNMNPNNRIKHTPQTHRGKRKNTTNIISTNIFAVRSRMLKVKGNYKNKYTDKTCRWCKDSMETQEHILKQCAEFKHITQNTTYETYFDDDTNMTKIAAETIHNVITKLSEL